MTYSRAHCFSIASVPGDGLVPASESRRYGLLGAHCCEYWLDTLPTGEPGGVSLPPLPHADSKTQAHRAVACRGVN